MTNLKRLGAVIALTLALSLAAFADCPVPGIMNGPPCIDAAQLSPDDSTPDNATPTLITNTPPAASVSAELDPVSLAEFAFNVLTLF